MPLSAFNNYLRAMDYFEDLLQLLAMEREADRLSYLKLAATTTVAQRRANGMSWYPVAIRGTEIGRGDYLTIELERTTHQDIPHQFRFGHPVMLFSNHDPKADNVSGTISFVAGDRMKISLRVDELPDWSSDGKLGVDILFDENSYQEMENALKEAERVSEEREEGKLTRIIIGEHAPTYFERASIAPAQGLNPSQQSAVEKILSANELAIVHGPPGTGKTTTIIQAIKKLIEHDGKKILVVAPSNAAVDLLSDKLALEGLNVLRVGNPAKVSERLMSLTLDSKMTAHPQMKEIKRLRKQAAEYRNMAHKYKRQFGKAEREQRKALFDEARKIMKDVGRAEQYITDDLLAKAQVVTATLVGSNHYTVRSMRYHTVVIDEAGQGIEPACWIPILKGGKLVLAGDHLQLPPTIKSDEAAKKGLGNTLLEKLANKYPQAVTLLEEQYRMHSRIMQYSSDTFYEGKLQAHASVAGHTLFQGDEPMLFIDTAGCGFEEKAEGTSTSNPEEAQFAIKHLAILADELKQHYAEDAFPSVAVISPYKMHLHELHEALLHTPALAPLEPRISINTVDSFQGQERDIVYISMTRSNSDGVIGFLSDIRRMNVAMTRARKKLVVIGDSATLSVHPFYKAFIAYAEEIGGYRSAWEWMG
jgi:ATP-dependent RNA/DNA helicase IGHMBP2